MLTAYASVHAEVDGLINRAKELAKETSELITIGSSAIRPGMERFALSKRDIAGIAAKVWLDIQEALANEQPTSLESRQAFVSYLLKLKEVGYEGISWADLAVTARPTLDALGIDPSQKDMDAIGRAIVRYFPTMMKDVNKLEKMDFSPPKLAAIAPPVPKKQITWQDLFSGWLKSTGGVLETDGYGVSQERQAPYQVAIKEFEKYVANKPATALTAGDARNYVSWLEERSGLAPRTQQARISCLKNLMKTGVRKGLIETNIFADFVISTPAGLEDEQGYRALTKQEIITIFATLAKETTLHYKLVPYILIATGCRLSEALQLRTTDIKQTQSGVWFIDWVHEPLAALPMMLKTKAKNNRRCPMHPRLIQAGLPQLQKGETQRIFQNAPSSSCFSQWWKGKLQRLSIWEKRKTVLHSLRGSARDLWREAGMRQDYRNAMTGHISKDVGEASYGSGLKTMPDVVAKELKKVDLDWLP